MESPPRALFKYFFRLLPWLACALLAGVGGGCAGPGGIAQPEVSSTFAPTSPLAPSYSPTPIAPAPLTPAPTPRPVAGGRVYLGIDVEAERNFSDLRGLRVGLLTHQAGVNREGVSTIEILRRAPGVKLVALFAPEHGIDGKVPAGAEFPITTYKNTGLKVYPLFGKTRDVIPPEWLQNIDVMVVDLQDLGTRSYTFISCLKVTMEACFEQNKTVVVLDRPNPLGGLRVGGPMIEDGLMSYVGDYRVPYVFGLTIGELARIAKDTPGWLDPGNDNVRKRGKLIVVPMRGWRRSMVWADTGLPWIPTSPNIPSVGAAFGYAMTGLAGVMGNFSIGVGTRYPFRLLNYPGRKPAELAATLNGLGLGGLHFDERDYRDEKGDHSGVYVGITNWNAVDPTRLAFELMKLDAAWAPRGNPYARASEKDEHTFEIDVGSTAWWQELHTRGKLANVAAFFKEWDAQDAAFQQWSRQWWMYGD